MDLRLRASQRYIRMFNNQLIYRRISLVHHLIRFQGRLSLGISSLLATSAAFFALARLLWLFNLL